MGWPTLSKVNQALELLEWPQVSHLFPWVTESSYFEITILGHVEANASAAPSSRSGDLLQSIRSSAMVTGALWGAALFLVLKDHQQDTHRFGGPQEMDTAMSVLATCLTMNPLEKWGQHATSGHRTASCASLGHFRSVLCFRVSHS